MERLIKWCFTLFLRLIFLITIVKTTDSGELEMILSSCLLSILGQKKPTGSSLQCKMNQMFGFGYFRLFIVATGYPSERRPQKTVSCYGGLCKDTERNYRKFRLFFFFFTCSAYSTVTRDIALTSHPKDY